MQLKLFYQAVTYDKIRDDYYPDFTILYKDLGVNSDEAHMLYTSKKHGYTLSEDTLETLIR